MLRKPRRRQKKMQSGWTTIRWSSEKLPANKRRRKRKPKKRQTDWLSLMQKRRKRRSSQESPSKRTQRTKVKRLSNTKLLRRRKQLFSDSFRQNKPQLNQQKAKMMTLNSQRMMIA